VYVIRDNFAVLVSLLLHDGWTVAISCGDDPGGRRGATLGLSLGSTGLQGLVDLCDCSPSLEVLMIRLRRVHIFCDVSTTYNRECMYYLINTLSKTTKTPRHEP
jgi:hypothetical protein